MGRLYVDAHSKNEAISPDDVMVRGVVERIDLVPVRYRRTDKVFIPHQQLDAVPARSTLDRDAIEEGDTTSNADEIVRPELLVWLRTFDA